MSETLPSSVSWQISRYEETSTHTCWATYQKVIETECSEVQAGGGISLVVELLLWSLRSCVLCRWGEGYPLKTPSISCVHNHSSLAMGMTILSPKMLVLLPPRILLTLMGALYRMWPTPVWPQCRGEGLPSGPRVHAEGSVSHGAMAWQPQSAGQHLCQWSGS